MALFGLIYCRSREVVGVHVITSHALFLLLGFTTFMAPFLAKVNLCITVIMTTGHLDGIAAT
jgi:hypothetical protein